MAAKHRIRESAGFWREVLGIFLLALSVFLLLCLASYSPRDPSWTVELSQHSAVHNLAGRVGAYTSDFLVLLLGPCAYLVPLLLFFFAFMTFGFSVSLGSSRRLSGIFLIAMAIPVLGTIVWGKISCWGSAVAFGGLLGEGLGDLLTRYLNFSGSVLLLVALCAVGITLALEISLGVLVAKMAVQTVRAAGWLGGRLWQQMVIFWGRLVRLYKSPNSRLKAILFQPIVFAIALGKKTRLFVASMKKLWVFQGPKETEALLVSGEVPARLRAASDGESSEEDVEADEDEDEDSSHGESEGEIDSALGGEAALSGDAELCAQPLRIKKRKAEKLSKKAAAAQQLEIFTKAEGEYVLPTLALLDSHEQTIAHVDERSLRANAKLLESKARDFAVEGTVTDINPGPVVTMYEFVPAPGVKINKIVSLADDLSLAMEGRQVRVVAPLPNKAAVGIEIPNREREIVYFKDLLSNPKFHPDKTKLLLALGKDISGEPIVADLAKMPHLLVAGATGAGKSVSINTMILSLLYQATPDVVRFIMVDPKMLELSIYQGIPHLLLPVVTDPRKAATALRWAVKEMERRYQLMADINARNIANYNARIEKGDHKGRDPIAWKGEMIQHDSTLPYIVIMIDELADLMMVAGKDVEWAIARLAQMARAAGIHLILATQRPSVDVITGVIKANFPTRISFKVSAKHDSRTILDRIGAEYLLGAGDMLFLPPGSSQLTRVHGAFVTETEIARVVEHLKTQGTPDYREDEILKAEPAEGSGMPGEEGDSEDDALYDAAVAVVIETRQASISMVQRRLRIGYNRAARLVERMESEGVVSAPQGAKGREVLVQNNI